MSKPGWVQQLEANRADVTYALKRAAFQAISAAKTFDELERVVQELTRCLADASAKWEQLLEERKATLDRVMPQTPPPPPPSSHDAYQARLASAENVWVNTKQAAKMLGMAGSKLEQFRAKGGGPTFTKIGKYVRYRVADLQAWMQQQS